MLRRRFLPLALAPLVLSPKLHAQKPAAFRRVTAWPPQNGTPMADPLAARIEGKPANIVRALDASSPLIIALVLDLVGDLTLVDPARKALIEGIQALPPHAWTAILRAQDSLTVLLDPTGDRAKAAETIIAAPISGRPGLLETVESAASLATGILQKDHVRFAVLYVTDSNIHGYREDYTNPVINPSDSRDLSRRFPEGLIQEKTSKVALSLAALDAPVFIVHLAYLRDRLNEAYQNGLGAMAEATGGLSSVCRSAADIPGEIRGVLSRIASHWAVDLAVPENLPRNFTVELRAGDTLLQHRTRFVRGKEVR